MGLFDFLFRNKTNKNEASDETSEVNNKLSIVRVRTKWDLYHRGSAVFDNVYDCLYDFTTKRIDYEYDESGDLKYITQETKYHLDRIYHHIISSLVPIKVFCEDSKIYIIFKTAELGYIMVQMPPSLIDFEFIIYKSKTIYKFKWAVNREAHSEFFAWIKENIYPIYNEYKKDLNL